MAIWQVQAERMVAALLHVESYEDVDPQHPLGGRDGLKDVLCRKDGLTWVAAAYFPTTAPTFTHLKSKFTDDFAGVARNRAQAFAFFVNQHLTIGKRQALIDFAGGVRAEIYHLERLAGLLNAPKGCGIRLEYLRLPMTEAEQWAFWSTMNADIVERLAANEARRDTQLRTLDRKIDDLLDRTMSIETNLRAQTSSLAASVGHVEMPTASLSVSTLCWIHRIVTEGSNLPEAVRGRLRTVQSWIGTPREAGAPANIAFTPPPPDQLPNLTSAFVMWWRQRHWQLHRGSRPEIIKGLAEFHVRFLSIHPFLDANGRVARCLVDQAARELLNQSIGQDFTSSAADYYAALSQARAGDLTALEHRVAAALT
jgi:fido (protein-threonine AMPylation protein)